VASQPYNKRHLGVREWFSNALNTILFIFILFTIILALFIFLLIYKMNPKFRNWIKSWCKKKEIEVEKETLEKDWERYIQRKRTEKKKAKEKVNHEREHSVYYQRVFTKDSNINSRQNFLKSDKHEESEAKNGTERGALVKKDSDLEVGTEQKNAVPHTDTDREGNSAEVDVDFQGLGLRKYLEKQNIISVERPDFTPERMGKRSKIEYIKDLAYFKEELNRIGANDIIEESEKRRFRKQIEEKAKEEIKKQYEGEGDEELFVDKQEDSFERKKSNVRELM
jgi:lipopolysaccharide export LptBFGC system permease protein LptF